MLDIEMKKFSEKEQDLVFCCTIWPTIVNNNLLFISK